MIPLKLVGDACLTTRWRQRTGVMRLPLFAIIIKPGKNAVVLMGRDISDKSSTVPNKGEIASWRWIKNNTESGGFVTGLPPSMHCASQRSRILPSTTCASCIPASAIAGCLGIGTMGDPPLATPPYLGANPMSTHLEREKSIYPTLAYNNRVDGRLGPNYSRAKRDALVDLESVRPGI